LCKSAWSFLVRSKTDLKTVQALLRHSDVKTMLQLYAHTVTEDPLAAQGQVLDAPIEFDNPGQTLWDCSELDLMGELDRARAADLVQRIQTAALAAAAKRVVQHHRSLPELR
jgi:hypothetical protein